MCGACRVSNELGAGNPKTARHTTNVGLFFFRYITGPLLPSAVNSCLAVSFGAHVRLLLLLFSPGLLSSSVKLLIYTYIRFWHAQLKFFA